MILKLLAWIASKLPTPELKTGQIFLTEDACVNEILLRIYNRHKAGMQSYGVTLTANPADVSFWIDSTIEELLDAAAYLERLKQEIKKPKIPEIQVIQKRA